MQEIGSRGTTLWLLAILTALSGCAAPEAPTEISDLSRFMVREFENPNPGVLRAGVSNFAELLDAVDYDASTAERAVMPASLTEDDVFDVELPEGIDLEAATEVAVFYQSRHPVSAHESFSVEADQLAAEPNTDMYERAFLEGQECFGTCDCEALRTVNDITRQNMLFELEFELKKDFRHLETDDGRAVLVARAWTEETFPATGSSAELLQSWTLDVWIDSDEGARRYRANWAETVFDPPIDEDLIRVTTRNGMDNALATADEALDAR
ncbi:MAG: hypothetical protein KDA24_02455 [Deltaproteobacteria bacterium]|nr:hypothetical protein [Deltaproteobacteria bacterium]